MAIDRRHIKIIIAGGGTGGHIFPGLAIAGSLRQADSTVQILFVGAKGKMEMQRVPEAGYEITGIDIAGFNRSSVLKNLSLPFKLLRSYFQVKKILKNFKPDAVVGVGGYSSFPVLRLAQSAGIPSFIHESNSLPGKSNLILGKRATGIFVATDGMEKYFPADRITISGNPVRESIVNKSGRKEAAEFFGLKPENKIVLVVGGSLGARSINEAIAVHIGFFDQNNLQLIWQTGRSFSKEAIKDKLSPNIWMDTFINRMDMAYSAADVVVARAGAMTISELQIQGKASILVPYPFAAEDHQTVNAQKLVEKKAALMVSDNSVHQKLFEVLNELLNNHEEVEMLGKNISVLAEPEADKIIAKEVLKRIQK